MSRTDKDTPTWVSAARAAEQGRPTTEFHSAHCADHHARDFVVRRVDRAEAAANGWPEVASYGVPAGMSRIFARVPKGPFPCDIDTSAGACTRYAPDPERRFVYYDGPTRAARRTGYFGPERAHVRAALHTAAKEYRATGDVDTEPLNRQTRSSDWWGGWWD